MEERLWLPIFLNQFASSARCSVVKTVLCVTFCRAAVTKHTMCNVTGCAML